MDLNYCPEFWHLLLKGSLILTLVLMNPDYALLSVGFGSGSALFVIKYVTMYQQSGSSNLTG